ncbi:hypothetical protein ALI44B_00835 [Leifsonia sp. ALI-44-B]|nr:hypothetical protein ALI44B_00835 [Leifsonia sp. ALI-44-B]
MFAIILLNEGGTMTIKKRIGAAALAVSLAAGMTLATGGAAQAAQYKTVYIGSLWDCWNYKPPKGLIQTRDCYFVFNVNGGVYAKDFRIGKAVGPR